jgi:DNA polymerase I
MKRRVILDTETNGLLDTVSKIWCIVCKDIDTGEIFRFRPKTPLSGHIDFKDEFLEFIKDVDLFIGHNIIGYDIRVLSALLEVNIPISKCVDTLVLSRLFRPVSPFADTILNTDNRIGGHSLEAWGKRLGFLKGEYNDWTHFNEAMLEYCVQDVNLTEKIYHYLMEKESQGFSEMSIRLEHKVADLLAQQEANGFYLDKVEANKLLETTDHMLKTMDEILAHLFPPRPKFLS